MSQKIETQKTQAEPPVGGAEFATEAGPNPDFEGSHEGANDQIDRDDQGAAVEIKTAFPHAVTGDGCVVLPDEAESVTKVGLIIPDVAKKRIQTGRVLALGPGKMHPNGYLEKPAFKAGSRVLFGKYAGEQLSLTYNGREVLLMRQHDVRLVLGS